jgi:dTDP-4-amino-4,6-dideoxygalactose transaminase
MTEQKVPLCDPKAEYEEIRDEVDKAVLRVLASGQYILGPEVERFEEEVADYLGVKHAIGVSNGSDALYLALQALGVGAGDEVIVPAFTFFATAGSVVRAGAVPVFADVRADTQNLDPAEFARRITARTKAVIPVHLYGQPADIAEIKEIARENGLFVIEDAAQAFGARYRGKAAGTIGEVGCFSFFPTKNLGACGDAGMVVTDDDKLAGRLRLLRVHGAKPKYYHHLVGCNSRLDPLQAVILRAKLPRLSEWTKARQEQARRYDSLLGGLEGLVLPHRAPDCTHVFHQYTVQVLGGQRDALRAHLARRGIGTGVYYPLPLHLQPCFSDLGYREGSLPESERASRVVLSLPMFPTLTLQEQEYVASEIKTFLEEHR